MSKDDQQSIEQLSEQVDNLTGDLKRVQADFVNFKRRTEEEKADLLDFAKSRIVREFLGVRDTFDREQANRPKDIDTKWAESIDAIRKQFDSAMNKLGVERFESVGHAFDPHRHEALVMDDGEGEHEVVTEELQPGYALGKTILRPAMVKVGRSTAAPKTDENSSPEAGDDTESHPAAQDEVPTSDKAKEEALETIEADKAEPEVKED